ncbi:MAG: ATP-binding cassette domain-containing protein [Myxococcota bacterium]
MYLERCRRGGSSPNGAGKTTCLRMLATLLKPERGDITVCGFNVSEQTEQVRRVLGYQTGDTRLYERLTPIEFLRYFGDLHGMQHAFTTSRIRELVALLGIEDYQHQLCGSLSTGQQQRVGIARALLHDPQVLILDEPTNGLDIISSQFLVEFLQRERERGKAIIVSTHIMGEAELLCDRLGIIHQGHLLWSNALPVLLQDTGEPTLTRGFLTIIEQHNVDTTPTRGA